MKKRRYRLSVTLLCQLLALVLMPIAVRAQTGAPPHIAAELVAAPAAPGSEDMVAIHMTPEKGWHGYWSNPGDAGLGMELDLSLIHI